MCIEFLKSSIGRKAVMAVTGIILYLFVIAHMLGNLQIFLGPDRLNDYAKHLQDLPMLLWPARAFLLSTLLIHIFVSLSLAIENKNARPVRYAHEDTVQATLASRTMVVTGLVVFLFVVYHLMNFTFGTTHPRYFHLVDAQGRHDVYSMVILSFHDLSVSVSYILAMAALCLHLSHGGMSAFQSLGMNDEKKMCALKKLSLAAAVVIFIGNTSIPLAALLGFLKTAAGGGM